MKEREGEGGRGREREGEGGRDRHSKGVTPLFRSYFKSYASRFFFVFLFFEAHGYSPLYAGTENAFLLDIGTLNKPK